MCLTTNTARQLFAGRQTGDKHFVCGTVHNHAAAFQLRFHISNAVALLDTQTPGVIKPAFALGLCRQNRQNRPQIRTVRQINLRRLQSGRPYQITVRQFFNIAAHFSNNLNNTPVPLRRVRVNPHNLQSLRLGANRSQNCKKSQLRKIALNRRLTGLIKLCAGNSQSIIVQPFRMNAKLAQHGQRQLHIRTRFERRLNMQAGVALQQRKQQTGNKLRTDVAAQMKITSVQRTAHQPAILRRSWHKTQILLSKNLLINRLRTLRQTTMPCQQHRQTQQRHNRY